MTGAQQKSYRGAQNLGARVNLPPPPSAALRFGKIQLLVEKILNCLNIDLTQCTMEILNHLH
jgi:hypothetical protein